MLVPSFPTSSIFRSHSGNELSTDVEKCWWSRFVYLHRADKIPHQSSTAMSMAMELDSLSCVVQLELG